MDRLLRPKVFETNSSDSNAEKLYRHWKMTFTNYIDSSIPTVPADAGDIEARQATIARKKLFALFNNISADIFELVSDCTDYN